jgi:hypothetical protein
MSMKIGPGFLRQLADELEKLGGLTANITSLRLGGHEVYLSCDDSNRDGKAYTVIGITDKVRDGSGGTLRDMSSPGGPVIHTGPGRVGALG